MATCIVWTCVPQRDPEYKPDWKQRLSDEAIGIKSKIRIWDKEKGRCVNYKATHSEWEFSERYGHLSASATGRDACRCVRFKRIDYMKHPLRWFPVELNVPGAVEDSIFRQVCKDADTPYLEETMADISLTLDGDLQHIPNVGEIFYGNNAIPYDYRRVVTANILPARIIPGMPGAVWCSEYVYGLLKMHDLGKFRLKADTVRPDMCYYEAKRSQE